MDMSKDAFRYLLIIRFKDFIENIFKSGRTSRFASVGFKSSDRPGERPRWLSIESGLFAFGVSLSSMYLDLEYGFDLITQCNVNRDNAVPNGIRPNVSARTAPSEITVVQFATSNRAVTTECAKSTILIKKDTNVFVTMKKCILVSFQL
jgi:hypothetical protein